MDYSKMGGAKNPKNAPKHGEHKRAKPPAKASPKEALLARMKAAAEKAQKPEVD